MFDKLLRGPHVRFAADAAIGLGVFCALTVALLGPSSAAGLLPLRIEHAGELLGAMPPEAFMSQVAQSGPGDGHSLLILLAAVFSTLFALNLSFVRHIASAYRVAGQPTKRSPKRTESAI